jgi:transposase
MITITPQMKVRLYSEHIDFRNGIDGIAGICRLHFEDDPFSGAVFLFRNRKSTSVKILVYDGQGFWLCQKRLSVGRFRHWPKNQESAGQLTAREIGVLLYNGNPFSSSMAGIWKKVS